MSIIDKEVRVLIYCTFVAFFLNILGYIEDLKIWLLISVEIIYENINSSMNLYICNIIQVVSHLTL